jgi:hypothetical protein
MAWLRFCLWQRSRGGSPDEHGCLVLSIPAAEPGALRLKSIAGDEIARLRSAKAVTVRTAQRITWPQHNR